MANIDIVSFSGSFESGYDPEFGMVEAPKGFKNITGVEVVFNVAGKQTVTEPNAVLYGVDIIRRTVPYDFDTGSVEIIGNGSELLNVYCKHSNSNGVYEPLQIVDNKAVYVFNYNPSSYRSAEFLVFNNAVVVEPEPEDDFTNSIRFGGFDSTDYDKYDPETGMTLPTETFLTGVRVVSDGVSVPLNEVIYIQGSNGVYSKDFIFEAERGYRIKSVRLVETYNGNKRKKDGSLSGYNFINNDWYNTFHVNVYIDVEEYEEETPEYKDSFSNVYLIGSTDFESLQKEFFKILIGGMDESGSSAPPIDYSNFISNLRLLPFDVPDNYLDGFERVKLGEATFNTLGRVINNDVVSIDCGSVFIEGVYSNSLDFYNASVELFFPYLDNAINLEPINVVNREVKTVLNVNIQTGDSTLNIYSDDVLIRSERFMFGREIPLAKLERSLGVLVSEDGALNDLIKPRIEYKYHAPDSLERLMVECVGGLKGGYNVIERVINSDSFNNLFLDDYEKLIMLLNEGVIIND